MQNPGDPNNYNEDYEQDPDKMQQEAIFQQQMQYDEEIELKKKIALYYHQLVSIFYRIFFNKLFF